ncbi:MAG: serine hydrolase, partial [Tepidisphaerales bacterium]
MKIVGIVCSLALIFGTTRADGGLEARLTPLAQAHKGKVAIAVKHLATGETYFLHADEPMPTASLIKVAVLMEAYKQA